MPAQITARRCLNLTKFADGPDISRNDCPKRDTELQHADFAVTEQLTNAGLCMGPGIDWRDWLWKKKETITMKE